MAERCQTCRGSGLIRPMPSEDLIGCPVCEGLGVLRRPHNFPKTSTLYLPRDVQLDRCDYCSQTRNDSAPECPGNQPATVDGVAWLYRRKLDQLVSTAAASSMSAAWTLHGEIESARKRLHDHLDGNGLTGSVHDDRTSS